MVKRWKSFIIWITSYSDMWQYVNTNIILSLGYLLYFLYAGYGYSWETHLPEIVCLKIIMLKSSGCSKSQQWLRGSHMWLYLCVSLSQCWINKRIETRWPTKSVTKNKAVLYCKRVSYVTITLDCSLFLFPPPFFFFELKILLDLKMLTQYTMQASTIPLP